MSYLVDYHIHSIHSTDAVSTIIDICQAAVSNGLSEICITDHFEPTSEDPFYSVYDQKSYWAEIAKAKQLYKGKLKIKMGVELGQPHFFQEGSRSVLKDFPYDYVIGSAHKMADGKDMSEIDYLSISMEDVCTLYLRQLDLLLDWKDFDCVGHLDLIKRYSTNTYGKNLSLKCRFELLTAVLKKIIGSGKGIEINTSGLRQAPKETMPGPDVLSLYRELGGEILTIGSDSHKATDVGKGIKEAIELAEYAGFKYMTVFNERIPEQIPLKKQKAFSASQI